MNTSWDYLTGPVDPGRRIQFAGPTASLGSCAHRPEVLLIRHWT
jgi:hypothetical protein